MKLVEAEKYRAYARECLRLGEKAEKPDAREKLMELSRVWTEAALNEERHYLTGTPANPAPEAA
jgi:hypothetical protein